jgi:hypothetical protein
MANTTTFTSTNLMGVLIVIALFGITLTLGIPLVLKGKSAQRSARLALVMGVIFYDVGVSCYFLGLFSNIFWFFPCFFMGTMWVIIGIAYEILLMHGWKIVGWKFQKSS